MYNIASLKVEYEEIKAQLEAVEFSLKASGAKMGVEFHEKFDRLKALVERHCVNSLDKPKE